MGDADSVRARRRMSPLRHSRHRVAAHGPPIRVSDVSYKETDLSYDIKPHIHRIHQWYICLHGGMTIPVDGVTHELHPEQSLIVAPGSVRAPRCRRKAPGYMVVMFECLDLDIAPIVARVLDLPHELREDLFALVEELRLPSDAESNHLLRALVARLLIGHKRAVRSGQPHLSGLNAAQHDGVVRHAEAYMQRNLGRKLARAEIARAVHVSEPHLARLFRASIGKTILERLTEMRIEHAKMLLRESPLSVTQIAFEVGISSFSHFAKVFRRLVGAAPSDYRRSGGRVYS
jgi:AraC-like DNA-binding protein